MTPTERKVFRWVKEIGANMGQLDMLVDDVKCQQAQRINSKGTIAQVKYLLKNMSPEELKKTVEHEMKMLRRHHMKLQSKSRPERNKKL